MWLCIGPGDGSTVSLSALFPSCSPVVVLWESHTSGFDHVHTPSSVCPMSPCHLLAHLPVPHVFPYRGQLVLPRYSWMCDLPLKHGQLFRGYAPRENGPFPPLSCWLATTPQLETGLHAHCPFLLGFSLRGLARVLCMLSHCCVLICAACSCC